MGIAHSPASFRTERGKEGEQDSFPYSVIMRLIVDAETSRNLISLQQICSSIRIEEKKGAKHHSGNESGPDSLVAFSSASAA